MSAHTYPSPVATEKGGSGKRIRATIARSCSGGIDTVLVELGGIDQTLVEVGGSDEVVEQPDAETVTPTATATASLDKIGVRT